ncbi:MAG: DUF502 domain-containing protein [Gammaproteobacteria bacterium]|nr:DUF502 domain-containing protein [Gammaproteobacteria bacterium]
MRFISRYILTGLVTILPVALTLYLLYWLAVSAESVLGGMIQLVLPKALYWPGMGLIAGVIVVFVVGLLMHAYVFQVLFAWAEEVLFHMPLIKSVYRAIRDFFNYFSPGSKKEFEQVVAVSIGDTGMQVIGFVTQAIPERLPEDFREPDSILVYLPMSYMIGGYAVLMPRSAVRPLKMNMEEAMRFTLTAGITGATTSSKDTVEAIKMSKHEDGDG